MAFVSEGQVQYLLRNSRKQYDAGWLRLANSQSFNQATNLFELNRAINTVRAEVGLTPLTQYTGSYEFAQMMPVEMLVVPEDDFGLRKFDADYLNGISKAYSLDPLDVDPLSVKTVLQKGQLRLCVLDGTLRYVALMFAKKQGAIINAVPVIDVQDYMQG